MKWIEFYEPYFESRECTEKFINDLEILTLEDKRHKAKIMMHQCQRLISMADDIIQIRPGYHSLQILFITACAENISKINEGFNGDGYSKRHVFHFFEHYTSKEEQKIITEGIVVLDGGKPSLHSAVSVLYQVRCDVVHEGNYWNFSFPEKDMRSLLTGTIPVIRTTITIETLKDIIVRSCIRAIDKYNGPISLNI